MTTDVRAAEAERRRAVEALNQAREQVRANHSDTREVLGGGLMSGAVAVARAPGERLQEAIQAQTKAEQRLALADEQLKKARRRRTRELADEYRAEFAEALAGAAEAVDRFTEALSEASRVRRAFMRAAPDDEAARNLSLGPAPPRRAIEELARWRQSHDDR